VALSVSGIYDGYIHNVQNIPVEAAGCVTVCNSETEESRRKQKCNRKIRKPTWEIARVVALCTPFLS